MRQFRMRIAHVIARFNRGGTATWLKLLIEEQIKNGHEVFLLSGYVQNGELEDDKFIDLNGIRISHLGRKVSIKNDLRSLLEIRKILKSLEIDLVNTHTSKAGLLGRLAAFTIGKPAIVHTFHGHILYGYFSKRAVRLITLTERILALITDLILVSGEQVRKDLINSGIAKDCKMILVRPGVMPPNELSMKKPRTVLTIGWLGRLTEIKRPDRVLSLALKFPESNFLIGGEGHLENFLKDVAPSNVEFLGWVNPYEFWSKCDIALLTSDNEAQPLSLVEAANYGIPAIAENVGSVREVVVNGETGFLTESDSDRELNLKLLIENPEILAKMGKKAMVFAQERFGVRQFSEAHENAYKDALKYHQNRIWARLLHALDHFLH